MHQRARISIALLTATVVFAIAYAAAASLNVTAGTLGAGTSDVTSCDDSVTTTYGTTFSASLAGYKVTTVAVGGIDTSCNGMTMMVTLLDASDEVLAEKSVTVATPAADPTNLDFSADEVPASDVHKVAVVIYG